MSDGEGVDLTFGFANMAMGYGKTLSVEASDTDGQNAMFMQFYCCYEGLESAL